MWVFSSQKYFVLENRSHTKSQPPEIHDPILILGHSGVGMELNHKVDILILITITYYILFRHT